MLFYHGAEHELDEQKFAANLRSSRRGTAGGPSGMTNEHLRPLLDNSRVMHTFSGWQRCWHRVMSLQGLVQFETRYCPSEARRRGQRNRGGRWMTSTLCASQTELMMCTHCWRMLCGTTPRIQVHVGKTKVYNRAGVRPEACDRLERRARLATQEARVWRGGLDVNPEVRGIKVLGTPLGHPTYVTTQLQRIRQDQQLLLDRIPLLARRAISVGAFGALCVGSSNLFLEGGVPRAVFPVRHISRQRVVGVSGNSGGSPHAAHQKHHPRVSVSPSGIWRTGFEKRCTHGSGSLLGQLG